MQESKLANNYAQALLDLATEQAQLAEISADVNALADLLEGDPSHLREFFEAPAIHKKEKIAAIERIFNGKLNSISIDFIKVVIDHRRQTSLSVILRRFQELLDRRHNRYKVDVYSAREIEGDILEKIKSAIGNQVKGEPILVNHVNPALLGGIIVEYEGQRFDASMRRLLEINRENLLAPHLSGALAEG